MRILLRAKEQRMTIRALAEEFRQSEAEVGRLLRGHECLHLCCPAPLSEAQCEAICRQFQAGSTVKELAERYDREGQEIGKLLDRRGLTAMPTAS